MRIYFSLNNLKHSLGSPIRCRFYRDYYRDGADPPAAFGLLLSAPAGQLDEVRERWLAAGVEVAAVTV
jgi:hypothetical protein